MDDPVLLQNPPTPLALQMFFPAYGELNNGPHEEGGGKVR